MIKDLELADVKLVLLCHALELTLKGWLVLKENTPLHSKRESSGVRGLKGPGGFGHNLDELVKAVTPHYPKLQPWAARFRYLNESYWGNGARDYEFPEGNPGRHIISPLDDVAAFIRGCRDDLGVGIRDQNGGAMPHL